MNHRQSLKKMGGLTALLFSTLAISNPAHALTLLGNYATATNNEAPISSIGAFNGLNFQAALGFDLPSGSDYTLDNISLRLDGYNTFDNLGFGNPDFAALTIFSDPSRTSNNPIGLTTAYTSTRFIYPNSNSNSVANFIFEPTNSIPFTFLANTRYWVLIDTDEGFFRAIGNLGQANSPTGIATNPLIKFSNDNGSSYTSGEFFNTFEINATEVTPIPFEFNPAYGLGILGGVWLVRKGLKKSKNK
jgi:hypothetical protein